jgi:glycosyltransferase involved in cell wall biosynthesis
VKVCVYAIMRDEVSNLDGWLTTTSEADARYVLDTGSTDGTHDFLHLNSIEHDIATFDPFRFDDARNAALALAPGADLYMRLDADERLEEGWRESLEAVYLPEIGRYRVTVVNHGANWDRISRDDVHVRAGHRWKYPTHEVLVGPGIVRQTAVVVNHHPPVERRTHHDTNLDVLRDAVDEYPGDHRMAFYYARELFYAGDWERARVQMSYFLGLPGGWPPERAEAWRILAAIDYEPERWLWRAIGEAPERREPFVDMARYALSGGQANTAAAFYALAKLRVDRSIYTTEQQAWDEPFERLGSEIDHAVMTGYSEALANVK